MSVLLAILIAVASGFPVVLAIDPRARGGILIGAAMLVGLAMPPAVMLAIGLAGVEWSLASVLAGVLAVDVLCCVVFLRRGQPAAGPTRRSRSRLALAFDGLTVVLLAGYALFALAGPPAETDFVTIWGLKGLRFWSAAGIDFSFLEKGWNVFCHPDYPLLLPLIYAWSALVSGSWADGSFGVFFVCFGLACLGVVRNVLAEDLESEAAAAAATCALVPVAVAPYLGMAEGPFIAYAATGVLFVRRGLFRDSPRQITLGAVLLGLAASTKNEGITLVLAAIVAGALAIGPRTMLKLWPAVAIPLPWIIIRQFHGLATDLTTGDIGPRVLQHLQNADEILLAIGRTPFGKPFFWIGIAVGLATGGLALVRRERFLLGTVAIQYLFYLGAYFVTPHDIEWHVKWSWERVLNQMTLLLAFAAISAVMLELLRRDENGKTV